MLELQSMALTQCGTKQFSIGTSYKNCSTTQTYCLFGGPESTRYYRKKLKKQNKTKKTEKRKIRKTTLN